MPGWFGNILVCTKEDLVPRFWRTYNSLKLEVHRYKDKPYGIKRAQAGGNGRQLLIKFDSLPVEVQESLGDPRKADHILERYFAWDHEAVSFYSTFQYSDKTYLRPATQEQYIVNASVLNACNGLFKDRESERNNKGGKVTGILQTVYSDAVSFNDTLRSKYQVTHNLPTNYRRFRERWREYDKLGYLGLVKDADKKRAKNPQKVNKDIELLLNRLFSTQPDKPYASQVHEQYLSFLEGFTDIIDERTGEVFDRSKFKHISEGTVKRYINKWQNAIGTIQKRSANRQKDLGEWTPYHSFKKAQYAGSLISIDDRQPPFEMPDGNRVWFYNGIDVASEAFTVWVYGKSKEGIIDNFYRQMVRNYAEFAQQWPEAGIKIPYELECETHLNNEYKDGLLSPGRMFQARQMYANNARSKIIERYFGKLRYGIEKKREGWLGRPFSALEANQPRPGKKVQKEYEEIVKNGLEDIEKWNNMEHSRQKGISRWEYFLKYQHPELKEINWQGILPYIGYKTKGVKVGNNGILNLNNGKCLLGEDGRVAVGDNLIRYMKLVAGKQIDIYWLDNNDGEILKALIYDGDRFVCEAIRKPNHNKPELEKTPDDEMPREIMNSYVSTINRFGREAKDELEPIVTVGEKPDTISNSFKIGQLHDNDTEDDQAETEDLGTLEDEEEEIQEPDQEPKRWPSWKDSFLS